MKQIMMLLAAMLLTACSKNSEVKAATVQEAGKTLVDNAATQELVSKLQQGAVNVTLSLTNGTTAIHQVRGTAEQEVYYLLNGQRVENPRKGLFIKNGKKIVL